MGGVVSTLEDLPEPPVPADTDLRQFAGFMLNVERLLASELWALSSGEEFKAALALWCRAWKQVPAGSLPNDERVLASFSGAGPRWKKVREVALRGFVKCSDGRLYHLVLCADVRRASEQRRQYQERRERDNQRLRRWRGNGTKAPDETPIETPDETRFTLGRQGQGQRQGDSESSLRSDSDCSLRSQRAGEEDDKNLEGDVGRGSDPPTRPRAPPRRGLPPDWRERWERWWVGCWLHVGKLDAERAYRAALAKGRATADELDEGRDRYVRGKPTDQKPLNPAKWLRDERWTDVWAPAPGSSGPPAAPAAQTSPHPPIPHALGAPGDVLRRHLGDTVFSAWCADLAIVDLAAGVLTLAASSEIKRDWLRAHYEAEILAAWREAAPRIETPIDHLILTAAPDRRMAAAPASRTSDGSALHA